MAEGLDPDLRYLLDRQAITDLIYRYCRAVDRHDDEMIRGVFHPDAVDNHGSFAGSPAAFAARVNGFHDDKTCSHSHQITCVLIEIDGEVAHTESFLCWQLRFKDGQLMFGSARYFDRIERRDGEWRIALRRVAIDQRTLCDGRTYLTPDGFPRGTWDRSDLAFQRPLRLPSDLEAQLAGKAAT